MTSGFYFPGDSLLHHTRPGAKMLALLAICCAVFFVDQLFFISLAAALVVVLYAVAGIPASLALKQIRPAFIFLLIIFAVQVLIVDWLVATKVVMRFATLIFAAALVTLTTRSSDMLAALEAGLKPLSYVGFNTAKISLALSLAIRFIPSIASVSGEVREAQRVRGLDNSVFAVAVPTIVRTLKMADEIADAIDARCYNTEKKRG